MPKKTQEEELPVPDSPRSRMMLRQSPRLRRRLRLLPDASEHAITAEETQKTKRQRKRSFSRVS